MALWQWPGSCKGSPHKCCVCLCLRGLLCFGCCRRTRKLLGMFAAQSKVCYARSPQLLTSLLAVWAVSLMKASKLIYGQPTRSFHKLIPDVALQTTP
jgi:hypothetical protein